MKKIILIAVGLIVVVAAVAFFAKDGSAKKEDEIKTVEVTRGSIVDKALAIGQIEPEFEIAVKSKVAGIVRTVYVEVGDKVNQGDPLFDVKPDPTPVEYANAKREVELYQVAFDQASRDHSRSKQLRDKQLISRQEYENSLSTYEDAELRLKLAKEKLALIESGSTEIADRTIDNVIKSPITGTVLSLLVEEGDPVVPLTSYQAGTELATLAQMHDLIFKGTVDEIDVGKLHEGMPVDVEIGALPGEKLTGTLDKISPKARKQDGATLFDVEITFDQMSKGFLRAGYSANADVIINRAEDILLVPERLVTFVDSVPSVEVRDSLGNIEKIEIETGLSDGINIEVVAGLSEGDQLVERPPKEIEPWD
ncbi:efflux RND transporter periplasmic adaptor subunit [bacterium]|nr:efflux RND transporter periplasmic adaptor subunit [bacterium]